MLTIETLRKLFPGKTQAELEALQKIYTPEPDALFSSNEEDYDEENEEDEDEEDSEDEQPVKIQKSQNARSGPPHQNQSQSQSQSQAQGSHNKAPSAGKPRLVEVNSNEPQGPPPLVKTPKTPASTTSSSSSSTSTPTVPKSESKPAKNPFPVDPISASLPPTFAGRTKPSKDIESEEKKVAKGRRPSAPASAPSTPITNSTPADPKTKGPKDATAEERRRRPSKPEEPAKIEAISSGEGDVDAQSPKIKRKKKVRGVESNDPTAGTEPSAGEDKKKEKSKDKDKKGSVKEKKPKKRKKIPTEDEAPAPSLVPERNGSLLSRQGSKKKSSNEAELEVVQGYSGSKHNSIKYTSSILNREHKLIIEKRQHSYNSMSMSISGPSSGSIASTPLLEGRPSLKKVAESFIKAYRVSKSLNIGENVERMSIGSRSIVTRGSLLGLVGELTRINQELDIQFLQEFLITHQLFMTSPQLLRILSSFYNRQTPKAGDDELVLGAKFFVQVRVLDIIDIWVARHPWHFPAGSAPEIALSAFLQEHLKDYAIIPTIFESLQRLKHTRPFQISFPKTHRPKGEVPHFPGKIEPKDLALHLTHVELNMFREVPHSDLFVFMKDPISEAAPELRYLETWSEKLSIWVARNICLPTSSKERGEMIVFFLNVAQCCLDLNNFNGVFQILRAFMTSPVRRLTKSWDTVSPKHKKLFEELRDFSSPVNNYEAYRNKLRNTSDTVLPSLQVYFHDLLAVYNLHEDRLSDGRVNFYKFHLIGSIMENIYCCQHQEITDVARSSDLDEIIASIANSKFTKRDLSALSTERENQDSQVGEIFGANLAELVAKTGVPCDRTSGMIPAFVRDLFQFLRSEDRLKVKGLFRMNGNKATIETIKAESDKIGNLWTPEKGMTVHEATGLLKLFFSSLGDSLFTSNLHRSFVKVAEMPSKKEQLETLKVNFTLLPVANRDLAISLLEFCNEVLVHETTNMMDLHNLSVIFGPTLFARKKSWTNVKEKFFNMRGEVDMKSLIKMQREQDLLRPLLQTMISSYTELVPTTSFDLPVINAVYHQQYGSHMMGKRASLSLTNQTVAGIMQSEPNGTSPVASPVMSRENSSSPGEMAKLTAKIPDDPREKSPKERKERKSKGVSAAGAQ